MWKSVSKNVPAQNFSLFGQGLLWKKSILSFFCRFGTTNLASQNFDPIFLFSQTIERASKRTPIEFEGDRTLFRAKFYFFSEKSSSVQSRKKKFHFRRKKILELGKSKCTRWKSVSKNVPAQSFSVFGQGLLWKNSILSFFCWFGTTNLAPQRLILAITFVSFIQSSIWIAHSIQRAILHLVGYQT